MASVTHYAVLGLPETATDQEIRAAYTSLSRLLHPDLHQHLPAAERRSAEERMKEVNRSYEVLSGPGRSAYDAELRRAREDEARRREALLREKQARESAARVAAEHVERERQAARQEGARRAADRARRALNELNRQFQEQERAAAQRRRAEEERRRATSISVQSFEGPGYRYEFRVEGSALTQEMIDALRWYLSPRRGEDLEETIEVTWSAWASGALWYSGIDQGVLVGLERLPPGTYRYKGRGYSGANAGPRGDHIVTIVHVDPLGNPVRAGFPAAPEPAAHTTPPSSTRSSDSSRSSRWVRRTAAAAGGLLGFATLTWIVIAVVIILLVVSWWRHR